MSNMEIVYAPRIKPSDYVQQRRIGKGSYGDVFLAYDRANLKIVAVKRITANHGSKSSGCCESAPADALREMHALAIIKHPNVIKLLGCSLSSTECHMVYEYEPMDLWHYLCIYMRNASLSAQSIRSISFQILKGVEACHTMGIWHCDLKPTNCLVNPKSGVVKIADFGMARLPRFVGTEYHPTTIATLMYRPPEVMLNTGDYTDAVDIWSMGCIFAQLWYEKPFFRGKTVGSMLQSIFSKIGAPTKEDWPEVQKLPLFVVAKDLSRRKGPGNLRGSLGYCMTSTAMDLLEGMFKYRPCDRVTAKKACEHRFFRGLDAAANPPTLLKKSEVIRHSDLLEPPPKTVCTDSAFHPVSHVGPRRNQDISV